MNIVVGVDGSKASEAALRWAARLADAVDAKLTAIHSHQQPYAEMPPDLHEELLAERRRIMHEQWLRPTADIDVREEVIAGDPRTTFVDLSENDPPDLIVLGRSGAGGGPGFLHLGSVVEHVAHHSRCPLAVIPAGQHGPVERIALGVDGLGHTESCDAAVGWCRSVAPALGASVLAMTVREPILEFTPTSDERNWRRDAEHDLAGATQSLRDAGIPVEVLAVEDLHPADALPGVAAARDADLLVIGTRGSGGFLGLRFGGIAMKVLHRASIPLVLVPPGDH